MAKYKTVVIDEIHVTVRVPGDLPGDADEAVRKALAGDAFMSRLRRAVRGGVRADPELKVVRVALSRPAPLPSRTPHRVGPCGAGSERSDLSPTREGAAPL
jgi:hypothetical protein